MEPGSGSPSPVVVRFLDGSVLKGTCQDFSPSSPRFLVSPGGGGRAAPVEISLDRIKAIFFVRSFHGNPRYTECKSFEGCCGTGRPARVTLLDGEVLAGFTSGYTPGRPGFLLTPVDPRSNNLRIFVASAAVWKVEWVAIPDPVPAEALI